jgi:hypothetical protein
MGITQIKWQSHWSSTYGGRHSEYYYNEWEKHNQRPYFDANYWRRFSKWMEETFNCKIVEEDVLDINGGQITKKSHIEFKNESDAIMFLLKWK